MLSSDICSFSNLHLVRYGPKGDSTNCFMIPLYYLTKDSTRKNALKEHLNAYVEEHSKLEKEPKLIVADFMMRTGKDDHGDPAGQRGSKPCWRASSSFMKRMW